MEELLESVIGQLGIVFVLIKVFVTFLLQVVILHCLVLHGKAHGHGRLVWHSVAD